MKKIYSSATKLVFLMFALGVIFFTWTGKIEGKDFVSMMTMVLSFYFGQKTISSIPKNENQE